MPQSVHLTRYAVLLAATLGLGGCNIFYLQPVQQGNVLEQKDVDQLKPGMSKRQVALVIGTPAVVSPFSHDRWDYVARFRDSKRNVDRKNFTVFFENGLLTRLEGDFQPGGATTGDNTKESEEAIKAMDPESN